MKKTNIGRLVILCILSSFIAMGGCSPEDEEGDGDDNGDGGTEEIVRFVNYNYIDLDNIYRISKFRSGVGHDYSDSFESCRSMKHYYDPLDDFDDNTPQIYAPVSGTVTKLEDESEGSGSQIWIQSSQYSKYYFILFHVNCDTDYVKLNGTVQAGHKMGINISDDQMSDIAVGIATDSGWRLVSYFDVMTDTLFQVYQEYGYDNRSDFQISKEERDANTLTCDGEAFLDDEIPADWVVINPPPP